MGGPTPCNVDRGRRICQRFVNARACPHAGTIADMSVFQGQMHLPGAVRATFETGMKASRIFAASTRGTMIVPRYFEVCGFNSNSGVSIS
jgi:hypothetical protein